MHWHMLPGGTIATNDGGIGNGRLRIPYSGRGTYNFNIDYKPHTQNKCPAFANVRVQGFNPASKAVTPLQKPALFYDADYGGVFAQHSRLVQLPGNPKGILYWEVSFQIRPATVQLGRGKMLHAGCKIVN